MGQPFARADHPDLAASDMGVSAKSQPEQDAGDGEQGMVGTLQFVVAGGDGAVLLEAIDGARDAVAVSVGGAVKPHTLSRLGGAARDDRPDAAATQVRADGTPGVALIADDPIRPLAGASASRSRDRPLLQQRRHLWRFVALPCGEDGGHRFARPLRAEVDFGREAAPGAAEGLIAAPFFAPAACW